MQDVSGGSPVPVEGTDLPIWGMEIDPEAAQVRSCSNIPAQAACTHKTKECIMFMLHACPDSVF